MGSENGIHPPANQKESWYASPDGKLPNLATKKPPYPIDGFGNENYSNLGLALTIFGLPFLVMTLLGISRGWYWYFFVVFGPIGFVGYNVIRNYYYSVVVPVDDSKFPLPGKDVEAYITIKNPELKKKYSGRNKIPMETLFEAYVNGDLDFNGDVLDILENRYDFVRFQWQLGQLKFLITQWVPETLWHSQKQDEDQVRNHYDRGDDFYEAFLGPLMTYTSGVVSDKTKDETLEELQVNKYNMVLKKSLFNRPGLKHLDIGCGWGPLVVHAAKNFKSDSTGVTLSRNQAKWGTDWAVREGVAENCRILCRDYREIPKGQRFDRITALEMAEHVGVLRFQTFLNQIRELLDDDGIFFMQVAGLRRTWKYEDLIWGLFMAKYIFPGADASTPQNWYIEQLERAGFEVQSAETLGTHYSATIWRWYQNWMKNRGKMLEKYEQRWVRIWDIFLAWSTIISRQGSATVYQFVAHKNLNSFDRTRFQNPRE